MKCEDCGATLNTVREEDDGLCAECMSDIYGDGEYYDERDADDEREQQRLDERGRD